MAVRGAVEQLGTLPSQNTNQLSRRGFSKVVFTSFVGLAGFALTEKLNLDLHITEKLDQVARLNRFVSEAIDSGNPNRIANAHFVASTFTIATAAAYYGQAKGMPLASNLLHEYLAGKGKPIDLSHNPELNRYLFPSNPATGPIATIISENVNLTLATSSGYTKSGDAPKTSKADRDGANAQIKAILTSKRLTIPHTFPSDQRDLSLSLGHATFDLTPHSSNQQNIDKLFTLHGQPGQWTVVMTPNQVFSKMSMIDIYNFDPNTTTNLPFNVGQVTNIANKLLPPKIADFVLNGLGEKMESYIQRGILVRQGSNLALPTRNLAFLEGQGFAQPFPIRAETNLNRVGRVSINIGKF